MRPTKLLLLGFSCTDTSDGYATYLSEKLAITHPKMDVVRCAFGGLAPPIIPASLRNILNEDNSFTHVVLEISTSIYAWLPTTTEAQAREIIRDIVATAIDANVKPLFLILHREKKEEKTIDFNSLVRSEADDVHIPYIDLSTNIDQILGVDWFKRHFRDDVHTNEAGGRSQAGIILASLPSFLNKPIRENFSFNSPAYRSESTSFASMLGRSPDGNFVRKGYQRPYISLAENERIEIKFDKPTPVQGLSFVMGPWSGNFKVILFSSSGVETRVVSAIDEHSYYERLGYRALRGNEPVILDGIDIEFFDRAEKIHLLKGKKENNPAEIRLVDLFVAE